MYDIYADLHVHIGRSEKNKPIKILHLQCRIWIGFHYFKYKIRSLIYRYMVVYKN